MARCEFLYLEDKKTCAGCRGWFCTALGTKKKLSDIRDCQNNPLECTRYLEAHPELVEAATSLGEAMGPDLEKITAEVKPKKKKARPKKAKPRKKVKAEVVVVPKVVLPPSTDCPYLGPIPEGCSGCCDVWCYAKDIPLRSFKHCKGPPSWRECRRRYDAERQGVKHAGA